jgi:hypothetical protein
MQTYTGGAPAATPAALLLPRHAALRRYEKEHHFVSRGTCNLRRVSSRYSGPVFAIGLESESETHSKGIYRRYVVFSCQVQPPYRIRSTNISLRNEYAFLMQIYLGCCYIAN